MNAQLLHLKRTNVGVAPHGFGTEYPCITVQHFSRNSAGHFSVTVEEAAELARTLALLVMQAEAAAGPKVA